MSQHKNVKNTSQVDVAFKSIDTKQKPAIQEESFDTPSLRTPYDSITPEESRLSAPQFRNVDDPDRQRKKAQRERKQKAHAEKLSKNSYFLAYEHEFRQARADESYIRKLKRTPRDSHLPYVKPYVVDRTKRINASVRSDFFVDNELKPWERLTPEQQKHLLTHKTVPDQPSGFASSTWTSINVSRAEAGPHLPPRESQEVRGGFVTLHPNTRIPRRLFSYHYVEKFRKIVIDFLHSKQSEKGFSSLSLDAAIRRINYRKTGPWRLYMSSSMVKLVHSNVDSLRRNLGEARFNAVLLDASIGVIKSNFSVPGPSSRTRDSDVVYAGQSPASSTPRVSYQMAPSTLKCSFQISRMVPDDNGLLTVAVQQDFFIDVDELFPENLGDEFVITPEIIDSLLVDHQVIFVDDDDTNDSTLPLLAPDAPTPPSTPPVALPQDGDTPTVSYQMATPDDEMEPVMKALRDGSPAIARIVALLYTLRNTVGKPGLWLAAITLYLQPDEMTLLYDYAKAFVSAVFPNGLVYQADTDPIGDMFASPMAEFEKSSIYRAAWQLFGSFSIHGILKALGIASDSTVIGDFFRWCSPLLRREPGGVDPLDSFLMRLVKFANLCATTIRDCIKEKSFSPIFSTELSFHEWLDWVNFLLYDTSLLFEPGNPAGTADFEQKLKAGDVPYRITSQMTKHDILAQLADAIVEGESLCKRHERDPVMLSSIQRYLQLVKTERIAISLDTPHGAFRVQPFGLMVCGPAGVGKSRICHDLHMACARKSGHRADTSGVLRIDASANFADGAMRGQSTVLFDDLDSKPAPPTAGHDDHVSIVNKYINVTPFNIEQASIEKKGKVWAGFTLALYTTNFLDCRLNGYCTYPPMFWRRFLYRILLVVKPEFANAAGGIDKEKLIGLKNPEIHNYQLQKFNPALLGHGNDFVPPYTDVKLFELKADFFAYITVLYKKHYDDERRMAVLANDDNTDQAFCPTCCLSLRDHVANTPCTIVSQMVPSTSPPLTDSQRAAIQFARDHPRHPNPIIQGASDLIVGGVFGFMFSSLSLGLLWPPRRRDANGVVRRHWSRWFWDSIPLRFDLTFALYTIPLSIMRSLGFLTPQVALIFTFLGYFAIPEFDPFIVFFMRSYFVELEVWLTSILFWPTLRFYQLFLPNILFLKLVRYYETSRNYLSLATRVRHVKLADIQKIVLGLTIAGVGVYLWRKHVQEERISLQSGLYKEYRRPPGVPAGETPYVRVMQDEALTRAYGIRSNPSTFTFEEMEAKIRDRLVSLTTSNGTVRGFRIAGSLIVCNLHLFNAALPNLTGSTRIHSSDIHNCPVSIVCKDQSYLVENLCRKTAVIPGKDLVIIHVPSLPPFSSKWNFPALLCDRAPTAQSMADEGWLIRPLDTLKSQCPVVSGIHIQDPLGPRVWRYDGDTVNGDCGSVLVIRRGATFSIAGFHTARVYESNYSFAESLSRDEFDIACKSFAGYGVLLELQLDPNQLLGHGDLPPLTPLPLKSSLRTTLSNSSYPPEVVVFGTLPGLGGASNKSRVVDTIFRNHPLVVSLESSLGSHPYFTAPTFGGEMIGDRWVDPHTVSLENTFNRGGNRLLWERSLDDFLRGAEEKLQCGPLVPLSDYDAFFGVQDTVLGGTNMQSSAGPPFYSRKSSIIRVDHTANPKVLEWDAGFAAHLASIEEVIRSGSLYSPFCLHVLKDEVISVVKNKNHKVRVFNILPFAFNHLMKRYLGPLVALMREHAQFFESAVGFNICNPETAAELYDNVARHPNCIAFDKSSFDARCSTEEHLVVCRFFTRLAKLSGYSEADCDLVFTLCLSAIYPIRSIKGDLFMLACSMPSGFWMTIHFNCVRSSLQARYAWFALHPDPGPFRACVSQIVLGDDLLATVSSTAWWYNQVSIAKCLLEIGALTTSFRKGEALAVYENIADVQFLKRQPRLVDGKRVWALDPKTLIKMLCMRLKSSEVPELDAHSMLLTNILSESWMWGREFFDMMDKVVHTLALKHRLDTNVYFRRLDFQGYLRLYVGGGLTTWEPVMSAEGELVPVTEMVVNQAHGLQTFPVKKFVLST